MGRVLPDNLLNSILRELIFNYSDGAIEHSSAIRPEKRRPKLRSWCRLPDENRSMGKIPILSKDRHALKGI